MGCNSSKRIEATAVVDVYRPPPSSFAVFDINAIPEPWLTVDNTALQNREKFTHVPAPILEKLDKFEAEAPYSWDEVSKALEDLKPTINSKTNPTSTVPIITQKPTARVTNATAAPEKKEAPGKSSSFHTLEELEAKLSSKTEKEMKKTESMPTELKKVEVKKTELRTGAALPAAETGGAIKPVKDNIFIVRDRLEREKEGKLASLDRLMSKRDPLSEYPEKCPPGGSNALVVYTTSLRGVRKTYEDCCRVRSLLEGHRVVFDERDVSLHGEFLKELRELVGEAASVPRVFVRGRYIGGMEEVVELNESGRLGKILSYARVERGIGRQACEGCGGARFVPCLDCGGSCKVLIDGVRKRCATCNENGLVHCPACI